MNNNLSVVKDKKELYKKSYLKSIVFSRSICSLGIVIFHYFEHANGNYKLYFKNANYDIGYMLVTCFFCMSGTVLFFNYPEIKFKKKFYYKRWKSILPSYYICNFYFYISISLITHKLIYKKPLYKLLLNLIGLDGYLISSYSINAFNLVGEWFLGAIIIIYILYPFLLIIINMNIFVVFFAIFTNYYLMYSSKIFGVVIPEKNIITCMISFYFGMIVIKSKKNYLENKLILVFFISLLAIITLFKIHSSFVLIKQIQGFSLYIIIIHAGEFIMSKRYTKFFFFINNLSYSIFLYHHRIIWDFLSIFNPKQLHWHLILLNLIIILTLICSNIHSNIVNYIIKSKIFKS